jgi:tight adherence protein B
MALLALEFVLMLLVSFALVVAMTRRSPREKAIDRRMASIQMIQAPGTRENGGNPATAQLLKATRVGRFGWFEEILEGYQFSQKLQIRIRQANSSTTAGTLILSTLGLLIVGFGLAWLFAPMVLVDLGSAAILGSLPYGILSFKRSRRINAFNAVLAESIDMLARALRAGHAMSSAIEMLAANAQEPAASEFREIFKQQNLGLPLRDALLELLDRVPSSDLRVLITAILVQKDTGGNLAEILDRTVYVIRERLRIQGEIRVQTAQGRLTGWILSALPLLMLVLTNLLNPGYSSILLEDPLGRKMVYLGIAMLAVGTLIIRSIVNGIEV